MIVLNFVSEKNPIKKGKEGILTNALKMSKITQTIKCTRKNIIHSDLKQYIWKYMYIAIYMCMCIDIDTQNLLWAKNHVRAIIWILLDY